MERRNDSSGRRVDGGGAVRRVLAVSAGRRRGALAAGTALLLAPLLPAAPGLGGQEANDRGSSGREGGGGPRVASLEAFRVETRITVDGRLDEEVWRRAPYATGFIQGEPLEGVPAQEDTKVWVLFDDGALYVGARLYDSDPAGIAAQLVRRDERGSFDYFEVALDPNLDRRTGYLFRVSAANAQGDAYLYDDRREDWAWDSVWESGVRRDEKGWSVEMRIPLSQIRYEAADSVQSWGVNFSRMRQRTREKSYFQLVSRLQEGTVSQFGRLEGLEMARGARRVELRPYLLSKARRGPAEAGNPFFRGSSLEARTGLDLRYGLGAAFTLDATVNPDFGQVEADPAVINLSAFETFYQERRPFFVEDARILDFSLSGMRNSLFYSRRIGRSPQGSAPGEADFAETPEATGILGAAKLTGRTSGGLSLGALAALTREESGRAYYTGEGRREAFLVEPRAGYGVVRVQQDLRGGTSQVGGIVTAMRRNLPPDGSFDFLTGSAFSAGVDFEHTWKDREWALTGFLAGSRVRGDSLALIRIQRASNHYFQRPDALWVAMDSTATSMTGAEWRLQVERRSGRHWTGGVWAGQVTPGLEINDLGFSQNRERLDWGGRLGYREIRPGELFRSYRFNLFTFHNWSQDVLKDDPWAWSAWRRAQTSGTVRLSGDGEFLNSWRLEGNLRYSPETMSRTATRGGPMILDPAGGSFGMRLHTDSRRPLSLATGFEVSRGRKGSEESFRTGMEISVRPSPTLEIEVQPVYQRQREGAQYVVSTSTLPFEPTFGRRYLFSDLERETVSMETRVNLAFTPNLTVQVFAQPLLSSGDYLTYKQLSRPGGYDFEVLPEGEHVRSPEGAPVCLGGRSCVDADGIRYLDLNGDGRVDYALADRDFNLRSLVGNAVVRWEYRPGSTLFLVWQRRQSGLARVGDFDFRRDAEALLSAEADNVFMVKLSYWLGM